MKILPIELTTAVTHLSSPEKCEKFFEEGFKVNTQNEQGCTLLMFAVMPDEHGDVNTARASEIMVDYLLEKGADPFIKDSFSMSCIDYAQGNIDPKWRDSFGYPLSWDEESIKTWKRIVEKLKNWKKR